jgi:hypothetical protein
MILVGVHLGEVLADLVPVLLAQVVHQHGPVGLLEHGQPGRQLGATIPAAVAAAGGALRGHRCYLLHPQARHRGRHGLVTQGGKFLYP